MFKPIEKWLLIKIDEAEKKTASGIILSTPIAKKVNKAIVLAIGEDVTKVKVGDKIVFHNSLGLPYDDETSILPEASVYGVEVCTE